MKKIMFNDRYGLTAAVLQGRKTMTRRICKEYATHQPILTRDVESFRFYPNENIVEFLMKDGTIKVSVPPYKDNEVLAVAQCYETLANSDYLDKMVIPANNPVKCEFKKEYYNPGWLNKMFVRPDLMPHQIQINDINIERLQDINNTDCLKEGIILVKDWEKKIVLPFTYQNTNATFATGQMAFAALIDKVSGKGTWERNPFVFAYSFKLIK